MTFTLDTLPSAAAAGRGVFVGRAGELAVLAAAAAAARRGQPQVVLVEGDAGGGKSSLLARFASGLAGATVLRAGGDEAEQLLPYGIVGQLVASARGAGGGPPGLLAAEVSGGVDPLAVGADLVGWLGQFQTMVLACIDDLQWADGPSARALLFALRRLQADPVLVVVSARPGELPRLGAGWLRFLAGDYRAGRVRLGGLGPAEVVALGRALGAGELPRRAVSRLLAAADSFGQLGIAAGMAAGPGVVMALGTQHAYLFAAAVLAVATIAATRLRTSPLPQAGQVDPKGGFQPLGDTQQRQCSGGRDRLAAATSVVRERERDA